MEISGAQDVEELKPSTMLAKMASEDVNHGPSKIHAMPSQERILSKSYERKGPAG